MYDSHVQDVFDNRASVRKAGVQTRRFGFQIRHPVITEGRLMSLQASQSACWSKKDPADRSLKHNKVSLKHHIVYAGHTKIPQTGLSSITKCLSSIT